MSTYLSRHQQKPINERITGARVDHMNIKLCFLLLIFMLVACMKRDRGERYSNKIPTENVATATSDIRDEKVDAKHHHTKRSDKKNVNGTVVRIIDGDTFVLLLDNDFDTRVRLDGIDCPERRQAFSQRAKKELSDLIHDKEVVVYYDKKDGFGRVLGEVYIGNVNVNHEMVRKGMAWHFVRYSDDEILARLEKEARENRVGLWSEPNPIPPWEYRSK